MKTIIVDVRTPKEYAERSLPGALNIPSHDFSIDDYRAFSDDHISLICQSGRRATTVMLQLNEAGFDNVSLMHRHMGAIIEESKADHRWTVDRQFRMVLAIMLGIFLVGFQIGLMDLLLLPIIICAGLLYSAITDNCYLKEAIAKLPWNQPAKAGGSLEPMIEKRQR